MAILPLNGVKSISSDQEVFEILSSDTKFSLSSILNLVLTPFANQTFAFG